MGPSARPLEVFDLSVLGAGEYLWLSANSSQGSVYGIPRAVPSWDLPADVSTPSEWLTQVVRGADPTAEGTARNIGAELSSLVFGVPDVVALFQQARGAAGRAGAQLLLRVLAAPDDIAAFPWEFLLDPQNEGAFLTMARDVHVVRGGRSRTYPVRSDPIEPPLNMLIVLSSPLASGTPGEAETPFDLYEERRALLEVLGPLEDRGLLTISVEDRPTVASIRERIAGQFRGFHLLHYLGHAQPVGLKLESPSGLGQLVDSSSFTALLQQMRDLQLAVFAGCETARAPGDPDTTEWPGPLSIADRCVRDACPSVIGMQAVLPFGTNRLFTRFFYRSLMAGQPVAEALRLSRLAIDGNPYSGGKLVNWSVPALFVGGSLPGPVIDPTVKAVPRPRPPRMVLRTDIRQHDGRFTSRLTEMREAIDLLCGRTPATMLEIVGLPGTGKSAFLDRLIEELDRDVMVLAFGARGLLADDSGKLLSDDEKGAEAALLGLCRKLSDLLRRSGRKPTAAGSRKPSAWWRLLLEDLAGGRMAVLIDDAGQFTNGGLAGAAMLRALDELAQRRGGIRIAFTADGELPALTSRIPSNQVFRIELKALGWPEVWEWIFRNLPSLTRIGAATLMPHYNDLSHLEQWEDLARRVEDRGGVTPEELDNLVRKVLQGDSPGAQSGTDSLASSMESSIPIFGGARPIDLDRTRRALRVAVAGLHTVGRDAQFSRAVTTFAADHAVSGRVASSSQDPSAALAVLVSPPPPIDKKTGGMTRELIIDWLHATRLQAADIVVLDFGSPQPDREIEEVLTALASDDRLVIAAGGNVAAPSYPAWYGTVLSVGAESHDTPMPYSPYFEADGKPDVYAPNQLEPNGLGSILADPSIQGTSLSALHAAAAAIVIWASDLTQTATDVRRALVENARRVEDGTSTIRVIDVDRSLVAVRRQLIIDNLQSEPLGLRQILATTGLRPEIATPILDQLVGSGKLRRLRSDEAEVIEDPRSLAQQYAQLRATPSGPKRTRRMQYLVTAARGLAARNRFTKERVLSMWESGHEGRRIVALATILERPELGTTDIIAEAIRHSQSAFEQYQGLSAALAMWERFDESERGGLKSIISETQPGAGRDGSRPDLTRSRLAERLLNL